MATVRLLTPGSLSNFARNSAGKSYGLNGDLGATLPLVARPVEILRSSAIPSSCVGSLYEEELAAFSILSGTLGVNSTLQIEPIWTFPNNANNKILRVYVGAALLYSATRTTSVKEAPLVALANRNSLTSQIQPYDGGYIAAGTVAPATFTIDFSVNQTLRITGQRALTSDALTLEYFRVLHFIGE